MGKDNAHVYQGGENGKNFAAIFSTNTTSRQESISQCIQFLSNHNFIIDEETVLASVKEYNESQNEFTVPVEFRFGWHGTAPVMGAVSPLPPMYLIADLLFQFYDEGKVRLVIKNFREKSYFDWLTYSKNKTKTPETILSKDDFEKYKGHRSAVLSQDGLGNFFTKVLLVLNSKAEYVKDVDKTLNDFLSKVDDQIRIVANLEEAGYCILGTPEQIVAYGRKMNENNEFLVNYTSMLDFAEQELANEKLIFVYPYFWQRDIKREFDYLFILFNSCFGGTIEGIAEDGELTWELVDGKLLPTDSKLRKQLIKNKQDYFSYYQ